MKVEIWSDFVCPFCYIGKRRFEAALEKFAHKDAIEVVYKSFELDPNAARDGNPGVIDMLVNKYGISQEEATANITQLTQQANELGLDYKMELAIQTNTFDAHRLAHFAKSKGKLAEITERLLKAHFVDSLHVGRPETLANLAADVGLDREETIAMLEEEEAYAEDVREDINEASSIGVRGVPFFVINRKYAISGAQPVELFLETLEKAWSEDQPLKVVDGEAGGAVCTDDGCEVPKKEN